LYPKAKSRIREIVLTKRRSVMSKNLISLVLVLAIASFASAGTLYWNSNVANGNWAVGSNWATTGNAGAPLATAPPSTTDDAMIRPSLNGSQTAITVNVSGAATTSRVNINYGVETLNILAGGELVNNGGTYPSAAQIYNNSGATINVYGIWRNERSTTGTAALAVRLGGGASVPANVINIYSGGLVTAKQLGSGAASVFAIGNTGTGGGSATVNVAGILDVDSYLFGTLPTKSINMLSGGRMLVKGNVVAQANADILAGRITGAASASYDAALGKTIIPEPATVALLGLGSLALLRRKR